MRFKTVFPFLICLLVIQTFTIHKSFAQDNTPAQATIDSLNKEQALNHYINGTVHRTIMFLEIVNPIFFKPQTSNNKFADLKKLQTKIIKDSFLKFEGNEVSWEKDHILTYFLSEENVIKCAIDIQDKFINLIEKENIKLKMLFG